MENKRKVYEVLEEKISPDNIVRIGELLALGALKYMCGHKMLRGMYADLARDIAYKDVEGYVLTESYDLVQEAAMFLCGYMGMTVNDIKDGEQYTVRRLCNKTLCHKIYELWKVKRYTESMDALPRSREPFTEFEREKERRERDHRVLCGWDKFYGASEAAVREPVHDMAQKKERADKISCHSRHLMTDTLSTFTRQS